jgi:predicted O-methyltransferase YrrM
MKLLYIGDISRGDAKVLYGYASKSQNIVEFGCGGSTQVLAHSQANVISIDTEQSWIDRTAENIRGLGLKMPTFCLWKNRHTVMSTLKENSIDMIFDDGNPPERKPFFDEIFKYVKVGGVLLGHDTRLESMWIYKAIHDHQNEITTVSINEDDSNITVITKGHPRQYKNWNAEENRENWEFSSPNKPSNWVDILRQKAMEA